MTVHEIIGTAEVSREHFEELTSVSILQCVFLRVGDRLYVAKTHQTDVQEILSALLRNTKQELAYPDLFLRGNADLRQVTITLADRWNGELRRYFDTQHDANPPNEILLEQSTVRLGNPFGLNGEPIEENPVTRLKSVDVWKQQLPDFEIIIEEAPQK
jgi:hypothetical protein